MRVVEISAFGKPEVLKLADRPMLHAGAGEVLIQVEAAGVSRPDIMQRRGSYPPPPGASDILGLEIAGVIAEVGAGISEIALGERVCALVAGGGYAEYCVAPVQTVLPIPETWTAAEAATLPENLFTVYDMLVTRVGLAMGETVLIHGGSGGIGSMAIMLARALNAIPITTAGSEAKCAACLAFGATHAINYKTHDFVHEAKQFTEQRGVDAILDIVGGDYVMRDIEALAPDGRIGMLAYQASGVAELAISKLLKKRASIHGAGMRPRSAELKGAITRALRAHVWPLLSAKETIRPIIDSTYPIDQAAAAHVRMEEGAHIGKIVLTMGGD